MLSMALDKGTHVTLNCCSLCMTLQLGLIYSGKQIDTTALDFTKAFDKVSYRCWHKQLHYYGIRGPVLNWIDDFLTNR